MGTGMKDARIRKGRLSDRRAILRLLASQRMATDIDPTDFIVAEAKGRLLGAARLTWVGKGAAFLRPIVVAEEARRTGLGRALLESLSGMCVSITVIARSDAVPFYQHLGFAAVEWSSVPGIYREECESCDEMEQCRPTPMRRTIREERLPGEGETGR